MKLADLHCDTIREIYFSKEKQSLLENTLHLDLRRMEDMEYCLQNFALFVDLEETDTPCGEVLDMLSAFRHEMNANGGRVRHVRSAGELKQCMDSGVIAAVLAVEEGGTLEGKMENLQMFYREGVRMMNLTWNYKNEIGYPNLCWREDGVPDFGKRNDQGLTPFGMDVIVEMERLGMVIDVSHLSDGGFWDVVRSTRKPFAASHSNAEAICSVSRNLTDEMIRAVAERGGIIGLNYCENFLQFPGSDPDEKMLDSMLAHLKHLVNTGGSEAVGLGSDFDGIPGNRDITNVGDMERLLSAMEQSGFTESQIEKICWRNAVRFYGEVLVDQRNL